MVAYRSGAKLAVDPFVLRYRSTRQGARPSIPQGERSFSTDTFRIPIYVAQYLEVMEFTFLVTLLTFLRTARKSQ